VRRNFCSFHPGDVVERPLLRQLGVMGWTHVDGADEDPSTGRKDYHLLGRDSFQQTLLRDRLEAALRRLNRNDDGSEWLDERRISQAISQLERPTARDFIAINEELHDKIVRGVNVSGPDGEHERRVRFIGFEPDDENEFVAVNQFRVDPPGAVGDRGFIVPDVVLFVNGLPLVVIEAKSPAVTDPIATAIDQMRRYANRRVPEKNEGAERLFWTNHVLVATDYYDARVGSVTARPDDFLPWRSVKPVGIEQTRAAMDEVCGELGNAADPLKAKAIDVLRHYVVNILPNDLKAQLVAASRELAVQYVDALNDARDEIVAAIEGAEELLPDLRQARDAVVKHFADAGIHRGYELQRYVDDCVAKLKDQKFRAEFLVLLKKLVGLFDTLMPRPEARPFAADVKIYAFIAKAAANLYRDASLDVRGVAHKVQAMLDAYIRAHGIEPTIPPIEILDPNFAAEVSSRKSDRAKAADMENALRHHISISFERDPAKFRSLSERLEGVLVNHHEDWEEIVRRLQWLIDEASVTATDSPSHYGLDPRTEGPIFGILRMRYGTDDRDAELAELASDIVRHLRQETAVVGFWDNAVGQEDARRCIVQKLDSSNLLPFPELDTIAADCMGVARANRAAFSP
jgi:hypothetical protein